VDESVSLSEDSIDPYIELDAKKIERIKLLAEIKSVKEQL
jgi:hypothetical protein